MKRFPRLALTAIAALATLTGCERESPTDIGGVLIPNESVRTFEVILDASDYLALDTAFSAFTPAQTNFLTLARSYENALNANVLMRFRVPGIIGVPDTAGIIRVDSLARLSAGRLVVKLDTVAAGRSGPVLLRLYRATEAWDSATVSWANRSAGTPWTTPGGTPGVLLDSATYVSGDSVVFDVDTATLALWRDSAAAPGALLTIATDGQRLRTTIPSLRVDYRTSIGDSIVTQTSSPYVTRSIYDPPVPAVSSDPRVGGVPSWRTVLQFREDIGDILVPCPLSPGCTVRLRDASIARAELLLQPIATQAGFAPELPLTVLAYTLLPSPELPLVRSPLAQGQGFAIFGPADFRGTGADAAPLTITSYIRDLVAPADSTVFRTRYLSLLQGGTTTFGYGSFAGAPQLRLRVSVSQEIQLP